MNRLEGMNRLPPMDIADPRILGPNPGTTPALGQGRCLWSAGPDLEVDLSCSIIELGCGAFKALRSTFLEWI